MRAPLLTDGRGDISKPGNFLVGIILLIVAFAILAPIVVESGRLFGKDVTGTLCSISLAGQQITRTGGTLNSPLKSSCERRFIEVSDSQVRRTYPGTRYPSDAVTVYVPDHDNVLKGVTKYSGLSDDIIYSTLAESMHRCWQMGGEGKQSIIQNEGQLLQLGTDRVCIVCEQIDVQTTQQYNTQGGFTAYLSRVNVPHLKPEKTYENYLFPISEIIVVQAGIADDRIDIGRTCITDNKIATEPVITQGTYATILLRDFNIQSVAGKNNDCLNTYVVPASDLGRVCDEIAN